MRVLRTSECDALSFSSEQTYGSAVHARPQADRLALSVYEHTRGFPREEIFGLTAQLRRAAVSVPSNIVEGCARNSEADYLHHFLDVAYASSREVGYHLSLATRLGAISKPTPTASSPRCASRPAKCLPV